MTGCVVIGCDNAAVPMKDILKRSIEEMGIAVEDMGVSSEADQLPYALTAKAVCDRIIDSGYEKRGVLICGTGIGMCMTSLRESGQRWDTIFFPPSVPCSAITVMSSVLGLASLGRSWQRRF